MTEYTLDTQILVKAGLSECDCTIFLEKFHENTSFFLVLDQQGTIKAEYDQKMKESRFGQHWLTQMASNGRITIFKKKGIRKPVRIELLDKLHFDPDDMKFIETASVTTTKRLVAEEDDYSPKVQKLLKKKKLVEVQNVEAATATLRPN